MRLIRNPDIEAAPLKGELLLFSGKTSKFFVMNETAAFLWDHLASPTDDQQLAAQLHAAFSGVSTEQALADVKTTVQEMLAQGLIREADAPTTG